MARVLTFKILWSALTAIGCMSVLPQPSASAATWFRVVEENIHELNYPDRDVWFSPKCNIVMSGAIGEDTLSRFHAAVQDYSKRRNLKSDTDHGAGFPALCMEAGGGDLRAALDLTRDLYFQGFIRVVQEDKICASACALAFIGRNELWKGVNRRFLSVRGHLRFHSPRLDDPSAEGAQEAYDQSRLTITDLLFGEFRNPLGFVDGDTCIKNSVDRGTLPNAETERQVLCGARISPELPDSLIYMFLATPHDKYVEVDTVEKALFWGIELYGLNNADLSNVSDFWIWQACENARWLQCHHPTQADIAKGCDYGARVRPVLNDSNTIPLQINRIRGNILRLAQKAPGQPDIAAERISVGAVGREARQEQDHPIQSARCGISVFRNQTFVNLVVQPRPRDVEWQKGNLATLPFSDREIAATSRKAVAVNFSPATMGAFIMRPWAWLPVDTPLREAGSRWSKLHDKGLADAETLQSSTFKVLNVCNDGPWLCPTSSNPWEFCGVDNKSSKTVFEQSILHFAVGTLQDGRVTFRGWYNVNTDRCVVPEGMHVADEFYIVALDTAGRPVKVFTESDGKYEPATQQIHSSIAECASSFSKYFRAKSEFSAECVVKVGPQVPRSLRREMQDDALGNIFVLKPAKQVTTIILTKGPNRQFGWRVGDMTRSAEERAP